MFFKRMSSVSLQTSRAVTSQCDDVESVGCLLTSLHMRTFPGRSCIGKVNYVNQRGLIKLSSADGLYKSLISSRGN